MRVIFATVVLLLTAAAALRGQPIFDYVSAPDAAFKWEKTSEITSSSGATIVRLDMTSQVWQGITWKHRIAIVKPAKMTHPELCFLVITGGNPGGEEFAFATMIANMMGMPIAVLGDIPNQPLFDNLHEDALISYTFAKYMETRDPTWPALYPMTKSAVRAMDALQALSEREWGKKIEGFIVAGASKRGWTTWFTGEVDKRVRAIAPMVYDNLNLPAQMKHHLEQWGKYSEQIEDYTSKGLPDLIGSEQGKAFAAMVDPYTYRDRATMPKLIIAGTNDRYWPLGAADSYFDDLVGEKALLYVPNSGHGLQDRKRLLSGMIGFTNLVAEGRALPDFQWEFDADEEGVELTARSDPAPKFVNLWLATAPTKDFREAKWASQALPATGGDYIYRLAPPAMGYAAMFMEFGFDVKGQDFPLSTQIKMIGAGGK